MKLKLQHTIITAMAFTVLLASCGKKSADEIFEEQKSGVVLVLNKFYYKVEMPGGHQWQHLGIHHQRAGG